MTLRVDVPGVVMRWPLFITVILPILLLPGCSWIKPRSDFERDPFVMSHLSKDSSRDVASDDDLDGRRSFVSASTSRKGPPLETEGRNPSRAADFSWIEGRVERIASEGDRLQIVYGDRDEEYGGRVTIEEGSRSRLLREGDVAVLEGELVISRFESPRYRVRRASIIN